MEGELYLNTTKVKDLMTKDLITISGEKSVIYASELMMEKNIGSVLVYEDSTLIGIITERDIVRKIITDCRDLCEVQAREIATRDLITIAPRDTDLLSFRDAGRSRTPCHVVAGSVRPLRRSVAHPDRGPPVSRRFSKVAALLGKTHPRIYRQRAQDRRLGS